MCQHVQREAIDRALLAGEAFRNIAARFETSATAIYRHKQGHLPSMGPQGGGGANRNSAVPVPFPPGPDLPPEPGTLREVTRRLWWGVLHCEDLLRTSPDASVRLKSVYALAQVSLAFMKVVEVSDLETRLAAIEALISRRNGHGPSSP